MTLEVFKTQPLLVAKVWGGRKLATVFGKDLPSDAPFGESWEVADLPEGQSIIASGELAGAPLSRAVEVHGADLIGTAAPAGRFPLLVKLLDAADDLSVQVHPGPNDARPKDGVFSKDECWLVLDADPDASIVHGLAAVVDADTLRTAATDGTVMERLHRVPVVAGDVFRVAPGTIHAICRGVALLEIQQPSDTTYRLYDYHRPGLDGAPRELHLDAAMRVATLGPSLPEQRGLDRATGKLFGGVSVLANVDAYRIERFAPTDTMSWPTTPHSAQVLHVIRGTLTLDEITLRPADTVVIPAGLGRVWLTEPRDCEVIVAGLGGPPLIAA